MQNKKRMLLTALLVSGLMLTGSTMTRAVAQHDNHARRGNGQLEG